MIIKYSLFCIISTLICQFSLSQNLDRNLYLNLLKADSANFVKYTRDMGFEITETPTMLIAKSNDFIIEKSLEHLTYFIWNTVLVISSKRKENNEVIYQNAKRSKNHKNSLIDKKYLYIESEIQNQSTNEIWYTVNILIKPK